MADKSGNWFLELILNVLVLAAVAFVTFEARGEQERGIAVPLFAAVSGGARTVANSIGDTASKVVQNVPAVQNGVSNSVPSAVAAGKAGAQANQEFVKAWGALQIWAAGLDGKITKDELDRILGSMKSGWNDSTGSARDYLKGINEKINQGQAEAVIQDAFRTIATQANDKKTQVLTSLTKMMADNGVSWNKIQELVAQWSKNVLQGVGQVVPTTHP